MVAEKTGMPFHLQELKHNDVELHDDEIIADIDIKRNPNF